MKDLMRLDDSITPMDMKNNKQNNQPLSDTNKILVIGSQREKKMRNNQHHNKMFYEGNQDRETLIFDPPKLE